MSSRESFVPFETLMEDVLSTAAREFGAVATELVNGNYEPKTVMKALPLAVLLQADKCVSGTFPRVEPSRPTKRLTVDVPEHRRTRFKALFAMQR